MCSRCTLSSRVNSPKYDDPACAAPADAAESAPIVAAQMDLF